MEEEEEEEEEEEGSLLTSGGGEKRSDSDKGWRHSGHRDFECFSVRIMQF